eukprot:1604678-Rhodomonas_salina.5
MMHSADEFKPEAWCVALAGGQLFFWDALVLLTFNVCFSLFLYAAPSPFERGAFANSLHQIPRDDPALQTSSAVFPFEVGVACFFACRLCSELVQATLAGLDYMVRALSISPGGQSAS